MTEFFYIVALILLAYHTIKLEAHVQVLEDRVLKLESNKWI